MGFFLIQLFSCLGKASQKLTVAERWQLLAYHREILITEGYQDKSACLCEELVLVVTQYTVLVGQTTNKIAAPIIMS